MSGLVIINGYVQQHVVLNISVYDNDLQRLRHCKDYHRHKSLHTSVTGACPLPVCVHAGQPFHKARTMR
jgi:hypothetical protein